MTLSNPLNNPLLQSERRPSEPLRAGLLDRLAGEAEQFVGNLQPYLPLDLIGGTVPAVAGSEDEAVWNAASQACGTEKVHYTFTVTDGRCWYLACPSSSLASAPDSWCPLAAALPGNSEFWDKETVYIYESEGLAAALRWDQETSRMQVFAGASRTLLPRIQSMDANFVAINPSVAQIVPWQNRSMRTEKLSRAATRMLLLAGLGVNLVLILVLFVLYLSTALVDRNLADVRAQTDEASSALMQNAYRALESPTAKHFVRVQALLQELQTIDGTLVRYEVKPGGAVEWEALVPPAYSAGIGTIRGQPQPEIEKDGRVRLKGNQ
jgi:hypothetical protein